MPTHLVDSTSTAQALPVPDAPEFPPDLDAALTAYADRERVAAQRMLGAGDADLEIVRQFVPGVLNKYRDQLAAVATNADLTPAAQARQREALLAQQRAELEQLTPRIDAALARARTFATGAAPKLTDADQRVVQEVVRLKTELSARQLLPLLAKTIRDAAASPRGEGLGAVLALKPYLSSWYEHSPDGLQNNADLWGLITRVGALGQDRSSIFAERRLAEAQDLAYKLSSVAQQPDSLSYAAWDVTPPPRGTVDQAAVAAASLGPLEAALIARGSQP